jgi:predicted RND superfamily exporter protein
LKGLLASSLSRGVWFSALTTGASFGALALSAHPGTASMGLLLGLSLVWIVLTTLIISPALLHIFTPVEDMNERPSAAS